MRVCVCVVVKFSCQCLWNKKRNKGKSNNEPSAEDKKKKRRECGMRNGLGNITWTQWCMNANTCCLIFLLIFMFFFLISCRTKKRAWKWDSFRSMSLPVYISLSTMFFCFCYFRKTVCWILHFFCLVVETEWRK